MLGGLLAGPGDASAQKAIELPAALQNIEVNLENDASRAASVAKLKARADFRRQAAETVARAKGWKISGKNNRGAYYRLVDLADDGRPIYQISHNANAAISTAANLVRQTAPYNLNGSGWVIGLWEVGGVPRSTHQELTGRITLIDNPGTSDHATHVAGTMIASGVMVSAKGMAPAATIRAYDSVNDDAEMAAVAAAFSAQSGKIAISNHSYGLIAGWYWDGFEYWWYGWPGESEDRTFGIYDSNARSWDQVCYNAPFYLPFKSAGNDRNDDAPPANTDYTYWDGSQYVTAPYNPATGPPDDGFDQGGFDTVTSLGIAKNIMTVGAVNDAVSGGTRSVTNATMSTFSGWGPTDDGRIKPDIVANGVGLYSCDDIANNAYYFSDGTSMSSPNAAGSAMLLQEYHSEQSGGAWMRASMLKGLIVHTADDRGRPGPDYSYGWGLMNTKVAADVIAAHYDGQTQSGQLFLGNLSNLTLTNSVVEQVVTVYADGTAPLLATICWTDPAGAAKNALDDTASNLVNDLDLRIERVSDSAVTRPYVLNPAAPLSNATTGDNIRDNVEQVRISSPVAGLYRIRITKKGSLTNGSQIVSLVVTGNADAVPEIQTNPLTQTIETGQTLNLSVAATTLNGTLHYQWYQGTAGDTSTPVGTDSDTFSVPGITANSSYWVRVSDDGAFVDSTTAVITVIPGRPTDVTATNGLFQDRIRVTWQAAAAAVNYRVYRNTSNSLGGAALIVTTSATMHEDTSATPGVLYYYFVRALDSDNDLGNADTTSPHNDGLRATGPLDGQLIPIRDAMDFTFNAAGDELFISTNGGVVEHYDDGTRTIAHSYLTGGQPRGIDISPDDSIVVVADSALAGPQARLLKLNPAAQTFSAIAFTPGSGEIGTWDVAMLSNTQGFVTMHSTGATVNARALNAQANSATVRSIPSGSGGGKVRGETILSRNRNRNKLGFFEAGLATGSWFVYDLASDTFASAHNGGAEQAWGDISRFASEAASGRASGTGPAIFNAAGTSLFNPALNASGVRFSPVMNELYVADTVADTIRIYETVNWQAVGSIAIPGGLAPGDQFGEGNLEISRDGTRLALGTAAGVRLFDISGRLPGSAPTTPTGLTATTNNTASVTVTWNRPANAADYTLYRSTTNSFGTATAVSVQSDASFVDTGTDPGQTVYYWVKSANVAGSSGVSASTAGLRTIATVTGVAASDETFEDRIRVTWTAVHPSLTYEIWRGTTNNVGTAASIGTTTSTTYDDSTPTPGLDYYYWVRARNGAVTGGFSASNAGVRRIATPTGLIATNNLNDEILVTWDAIPDIPMFEVYRGTTAVATAATLVAAVTGTVWSDTETPQGVNRYYFIRAVSGGRMSGYTPGVVGKRLFLAPDNFTATTDRFDDVVLSWDQRGDAQSYRLFRSVAPGIQGGQIGGVNAGVLEFTDITAVPGVTYYYSIQASKQSGATLLFSTVSDQEMGIRPGGPDRRVGNPGAPAGDPATTDLTDTTGLKQAFEGLVFDPSDASRVLGSLKAVLSGDALSVTLFFETFTYRGKAAVDAGGAVDLPDMLTKNGPSVDLALQLATSDVSGGYRLEGTVSQNAAVTGIVSAAGNSFNAKTHPAPFAGNYTLVLPHDDGWDPDDLPFGEGIGYGSVSTAGKFKFGFVLADTTRCAVAGTANDDGQLAFYTILYRSKTGPSGQLAGVLRAREMPNVSDLDGLLHWVRPAGQLKPPIYPGAIDIDLPAVGSRYLAPAKGERILSQLADQDENAVWSLADGNLSPVPSNRPLTWNSANKIAWAGNGSAEKLKVGINPKSGLVSGSFFDTGTGANSQPFTHNVKFVGVALQKQGLVAGHFFGNDEVGLLTIEPRHAPALVVRDGTGAVLNAGAPIDFGDIGVDGGVGERVIVLENAGDGNLLIDGPLEIGGGDGDFFWMARRDGYLRPGETLVARLGFRPGELGADAATVTIRVNDPAANPFTLALAGNGVAGSAGDSEAGFGGAHFATAGPGAPGSPPADANYDALAHPGKYSGLVTPVRGSTLPVGAGAAALSHNGKTGLGSLTLTVKIGSLTAALRGVILADGTVDGGGVWKGKLAAFYDLANVRLRETPGGEITIEGLLTDLATGETFAVGVARQVYHAKLNPAPPELAGAYTVLLPMNEDLGAGYPAGDGVGTLTVATSGAAKGLFLLADGSKSSLAGVLGNGDRLAVYSVAKGCAVAGELRFRGDAGATAIGAGTVSDIDGFVSWEKSANAASKLFPRGFQAVLPVAGSRFDAVKGVAVFPGLTMDGNPNTELSLRGARAPLTGVAAIDVGPLDAVWDDANRVTYVGVGGDTLKAKVNAKSGLVTGEYRDTASGLWARFNTVVFQRQGIAGGFFLTKTLDADGVARWAPK
ncbi:MAG: S8 family serine peptidase [Akkermansiaceae bacterium]|nr:S8 family serine peptidase [Akkermansiaceae bacterium]